MAHGNLPSPALYPYEPVREKASSMLYYISILGMIVVAVILTMGIWNMAKGGSPNRSQKLMRLRILAQFIAVILVMAALYFSTQ